MGIYKFCLQKEGHGWHFIHLEFLNVVCIQMLWEEKKVVWFSVLGWFSFFVLFLFSVLYICFNVKVSDCLAGTPTLSVQWGWVGENLMLLPGRRETVKSKVSAPKRRLGELFHFSCCLNSVAWAYGSETLHSLPLLSLLQITDSAGHILYAKEDATKGKFAFTTEDYDMFEACFESKLPVGKWKRLWLP